MSKACFVFGTPRLLVLAICAALLGCAVRNDGSTAVQPYFDAIPTQFTNAQIADWLTDVETLETEPSPRLWTWDRPMLVRLQDCRGDDLATDRPPGQTVAQMLGWFSKAARFPIRIIDATTPGNNAAIVVETQKQFEDCSPNNKVGRIDTVAAAEESHAVRFAGGSHVWEFAGPPNMFCDNDRPAEPAFRALLMLREPGEDDPSVTALPVFDRCMAVALGLCCTVSYHPSPVQIEISDYMFVHPVPFSWLLRDPRISFGMSSAAARSIILDELAHVRPDSS